MTDVIVMAYYMSGDRNTIASALHLNKHWCVLIIGLNTDPRTEQLEEFFQAKVGAKRVRVLYATSKEAAGAFAGLAKRPSFMKEIDKKWVPDLEKNARRQRLAKQAARMFGKGEVNLIPPGHATRSIGDWFDKKPDDVRGTLQTFWSDPGRQDQFRDFLSRLGFDPRVKYAFLWCKSGEVTAEKAHHFTDPISWAHLARSIADEGWMPVAVGDAIGGLETQPSLVGFWNRWQEIYHEPLPRELQLSLWTFIARTWGEGCCAVGMRSGMMEVPALVGIRTLYLEEVANQQRARMAQWLMKVTGWCRALLPSPPGLPQSGYWLRHMMAHDNEFGLVLQHVNASRQLAERRQEVTVFLAWVLKEVTKGKVDATIVRTISGYVDMDVHLPKYALSLACVRMITAWVAAPERVYQQEQADDRVVEQVLTSGLIAIQGTLVGRQKKVALKLVPQTTAVDPWPAVHVGQEVTGTREELEQQGFDKASLQKMQATDVGKTFKVRGVAWKLVRMADGVRLVLERRTLVLG